MLYAINFSRFSRLRTIGRTALSVFQPTHNLYGQSNENLLSASMQFINPCTAALRGSINGIVQTRRNCGHNSFASSGDVECTQKCRVWPRQESNLYLELRKLLYYPLYYEA
jgi:hypothetical protein